ncbi:MAG: peptidoglycan-binding domain-containing protein [bacterium]|nr:peptidoglycan-binding domain-containing protein [bacterium]
MLRGAFPKFLNQGSKGPAVTILQAFLWGALDDQEGIETLIPDGDYGPTTARFVSALQENLGIGIDGNFGPETRARVKSVYNYDFDAIPMCAVTCFPETVGPK